MRELQTHLTNLRLHVVAAPGAGKTVLGIEVLRRINKPTLILSPPPRPPAPFAATGGADPGYRRKF